MVPRGPTRLLLITSTTSREHNPQMWILFMRFQSTFEATKKKKWKELFYSWISTIWQTISMSGPRSEQVRIDWCRDWQYMHQWDSIIAGKGNIGIERNLQSSYRTTEAGLRREKPLIKKTTQGGLEEVRKHNIFAKVFVICVSGFHYLQTWL